MKSRGRKYWGQFCAVCIATVCGSAQASILIDDINDAFTINWSYTPSVGQTASAVGVFSVASFSASQIVLNVHLSNTSTGFVNAGITGIGFDVDPNATSVSINTLGSNDVAADADRFDGISLSSIFPSFQTVDVCAYSAGGCAGGAQPQLLAMGTEDYFQITLNSASGGFLAGVSIPNIGPGAQGGVGPVAIKFQTNLTSYEFTGTQVCTQIGQCTGGDTDVPAPAPAFLVGFGFLVLWRVLREPQVA
jgi:hypothetical protein